MVLASDVIWITGASSGIGRALALRFAGDGRVVAGSADDPGGLDEVAAETHQLSGRFVPFPLDIRDAEAVRQTVGIVEAEIGPIGLAVLAAGIHMPVTGDDPDPSTFRQVADVNLFGTIECLCAVLEPMRGRKSGQIAIVSSLSGYIGQHRYAAYGMSKAALINLTQALHPDLAGLGVKLQLVTPGFVRTPMTAKDSAPMPHEMSADEAARRICNGLDKDIFEISFPRRLSWAVRLLRVLPLRWAQAANNSARPRHSARTRGEPDGSERV